MEKFFRESVRGIQGFYTNARKTLSNRKKLHKLFHSRNAELAIIILLAIAIPLTVLGLQSIQDIREHAATATPTPGGARRTPTPTVDNDPDNPNNNLPECGKTGEENFVVNPNPAMQGQTVTFSHKDGSVVDNQINGFGNGVIANTCVQSGANVTCTARGNFTCPTNKPNCTAKTSGISTHTWFTLPGGPKVDNCQYKVHKADAPIGAGGGGSIACKGAISPVCDTANGKKPGLQLSWQMSRSTKCQYKVSKTSGSTSVTKTVDCGKTATQTETIYSIGADPVNDNVTYQLTLLSDSTTCNNVQKGTAQPQCHPVNQLTPTSTPKAGTGTPANGSPTPGRGTPTVTPTRNGTPSPTPGPGTPTTTPVAGGRPNDPCKVNLNNPTACTDQGEVRLTGDWTMPYNNKNTCKVKLFEGSDSNPVGDSTDCSNHAWSSSNASIANRRYKAGVLYTLQIESDLCQTSSLSVAAKACTTSTGPTPTGTVAQTQDSCDSQNDNGTLGQIALSFQCMMQNL